MQGTQESIHQSSIPAEEENNDNFSFPLHSIHHLKKSNIKLFGHIASVDCLRYFYRYLNSNQQITRIAIIGFNTGMDFCGFIELIFLGDMAEIFLMSRDNIEVVAFDELEYPYVSDQAHFINQLYSNRLLLIGGPIKQSISRLSSLFDRSFDMIFLANQSYPHHCIRKPTIVIITDRR